jgi:hypothetical protein
MNTNQVCALSMSRSFDHTQNCDVYMNFGNTHYCTNYVKEYDMTVHWYGEPVCMDCAKFYKIYEKIKNNIKIQVKYKYWDWVASGRPDVSAYWLKILDVKKQNAIVALESRFEPIYTILFNETSGG